MTRNRCIGLFGGTFDPIHNAHLAIANHAQHVFNLESVIFIPSKTPPHRTQPLASPEDRLAMARLATANNAHFSVSDIEIKRQGISYAIDTLKLMREIYADDSLCMLLGEDAFLQLNTWHCFESLLDYVHIIVVQRYTMPLPNDTWLRVLLEKNSCTDMNMIHQKKRGCIFFSSLKPISTSATEIRVQLLENPGVTNLSLPNVVSRYISEHGLYSVNKQ